jgi:GxxExxY protein
MDILYKSETYNIVGACYAVYKDKGHGFVECVYQDCLEIELAMQNIPFESQTVLPLEYKGVSLKHKFVADLTCYDKIIIELKAVKNLMDEHRAQLINYLKATGMELGLLINFGHCPELQWERIVLSRK